MFDQMDVQYSMQQQLLPDNYIHAPLDIFKKDGKLFFQLTVPGIVKKSIRIEIFENRMAISGERNLPNHDIEYIHQENKTWTYFRTIPISYTTEVAGIKANLKEGLLTLEIPIHLEKIQ